MAVIYRWWWVVYVLIYPLIFVPSERGFLGQNYTYHMVFTSAFVLGAALFEWFAHPELRLSDVRFLPRLLWQHKPVLLALLFGLWGVLAAFWAPFPAIALMGSLARNGDGALASLLFVLVFVLVYLQAVRDPAALTRIAAGVVASGVLLSLGAVAEVFWGKGLIFAASPWDLPLVSFPQKGHLAGYLVATWGVAAALYFRKPGLFWLTAALVIAFALGFTFNRAAFLAMGVLMLLGIWRGSGPITARLGAFLLFTLAVVGGMGTVQPKTGGGKVLSSTSSMEARLLFWKAALGGILERPILGWGGGNFDFYWPLYLTPSEQGRFLLLESGAHKMIEYVSTPGSVPVWVVENSKGERYTQSIVLWKSHNQFLEVALQKGLVGLGLYLALLFYSLGSFLRLSAGSGLWTYHVFLALWFITFFSEGVIWVLWALAVSHKKESGSQDFPTVGERPRVYARLPIDLRNSP